MQDSTDRQRVTILYYEGRAASKKVLEAVEVKRESDRRKIDSRGFRGNVEKYRGEKRRRNNCCRKNIKCMWCKLISS